MAITENNEWLQYWREQYSRFMNRSRSKHNGYMKRLALKGQVRALVREDRKAATTGE